MIASLLPDSKNMGGPLGPPMFLYGLASTKNST
jgi:hypothetical protein